MTKWYDEFSEACFCGSTEVVTFMMKQEKISWHEIYEEFLHLFRMSPLIIWEILRENGVDIHYVTFQGENLFFSLNDGNIDKLKFLLDHKVNINQINYKENPFWHYIPRNLKTFEYCLAFASNYGLDVNLTNQYKHTALMCLFKYNENLDPKRYEILLKNGFDSIHNFQDKTDLYQIASIYVRLEDEECYRHLYRKYAKYFSQQLHYKLCFWLTLNPSVISSMKLQDISKTINLNTIRNLAIETILFGDHLTSTQVIYLINTCNLDPNFKNSKGRTFIHYKKLEDWYEIVLFTKNNINSEDKNGNTPLSNLNDSDKVKNAYLMLEWICRGARFKHCKKEKFQNLKLLQSLYFFHKWCLKNEKGEFYLAIIGTIFKDLIFDLQ